MRRIEVAGVEEDETRAAIIELVDALFLGEPETLQAGEGLAHADELLVAPGLMIAGRGKEAPD